ncbi:MAG: hypothetical protein PHZ19_02730 [Candidatus Thermoplasmatota archaeon]|nr:hypothetical protein [Candidatus Thermoplasmatota archaeon]
MRKVKADFSITFIVIMVLLLLALTFVAATVLLPFFQGPDKALESGEYCVAHFSDTGTWKEKREVDLGEIYESAYTEIYVWPGGWSFFHPQYITVELDDGISDDWIDMGRVGNLEDTDVHRKMPCMGSEDTLWFGEENKDNCNPYPAGATIERVKATSRDERGSCQQINCDDVTNFAIIDEYLEDRCSKLDFASLTFPVCWVDGLEVKVHYECKSEMTLVPYDSCDNSVGWNYKTPPSCEYNAGSIHGPIEPCSIENGEYSANNLELIRQMPFPGNPYVRIGVRSGCEGIQTGCNVQVFLAEPPTEREHYEEGEIPCEGEDCNCDNEHIEWNPAVLVGTDPPEELVFQNLDYEYIFSKPVDVSNYINSNKNSDNYKHWCIKVISDSCYVNSIFVSKYVGI